MNHFAGYINKNNSNKFVFDFDKLSDDNITAIKAIKRKNVLHTERCTVCCFEYPTLFRVFGQY